MFGENLLLMLVFPWGFHSFPKEILAIFGPLNSALEFKLALAEFWILNTYGFICLSWKGIIKLPCDFQGKFWPPWMLKFYVFNKGTFFILLLNLFAMFYCSYWCFPTCFTMIHTFAALTFNHITYIVTVKSIFLWNFNVLVPITVKSIFLWVLTWIQM